MQSQNKRNSQFMIAKEVFINHNMAQIEHHYELNNQCLGEGGFGRVFEGRKKKNFSDINNQDTLATSFSSYETSSREGSEEQNSSQSRAIKQISYKRTQDKEIMRNEIEILSYLDHPMVVKLYETFEHKKQLYLVIDLLKGGDLFTVINQNDKLSESQAKVVFRQLIRVLCYLHTQHICHRDLKLQNVLFLNKDEYNLKLVDFGLAFCWDENMKKELKQKGLNKKMTGTPDYMSPEMLAQNYDERCDIWSAGVILYMLLSGAAPFPGQSDKEIAQKIKNLDYTFDIPEFEGVTQNAKDLIENILKPQNERLSLKQILDHPWLNEDQCQQTSCLQSNSINSLASSKKILNKRQNLARKVKTTRQFDRIKRKSSEEIFEVMQRLQECKSSPSEDCFIGQRSQSLTVQKMQHYEKLSKLQKLQAIYSVSKLSQSRTKSFGEEFLLIDHDNDGSVSLQDLEAYLLQNENFTDKHQIEHFFHGVALSQRGYISYSEYLACVLSYESDLRKQIISNVLEFDDRFSQNGKLSLLSDDTMLVQPIDIYDENMLLELFCLLDKNNNGKICRKDFINLLHANGIDRMNKDFIEEITQKIHEISKCQEVILEQKHPKEFWFQDPRKYKQRLSRTYKGQSDGGKYLDFKSFKHLMKTSSECLN